MSSGSTLIRDMQSSSIQNSFVFNGYYVWRRRSWLKWPRVGATRPDRYTYPVRNWFTSDRTVARRVVGVRGYGETFQDTGSSTRGALTPGCERHERLWDVARSIVHTHLRRTASPTIFHSHSRSSDLIQSLLPRRCCHLAASSENGASKVVLTVAELESLVPVARLRVAQEIY